jgi:hypothetical protein
MHEPARLATTAVSLPPASERLDIANFETAPNRPRQATRPGPGDSSVSREGEAVTAVAERLLRGLCCRPAAQAEDATERRRSATTAISTSAAMAGQLGLSRKHRTYVHPEKSCSEIAEGVGLEPT